VSHSMGGYVEGRNSRELADLGFLMMPHAITSLDGGRGRGIHMLEGTKTSDAAVKLHYCA
jgi:hypothetical protein